MTTVALVVILGILVCITILGGIFLSPVGFDEGYNLQVPIQLAAGEGYSTYGSLYNGVPRSFDAKISTGPTVLAPIAVLFLLFGEELWLARLVPTAGFLLLVGALWRVGYAMGGRLAGVAAVFTVLTVKAHADYPRSMIIGTGEVLGETTAAALLVFAALSLPGRLRLAGLALGLAVLTKFVALIALPVFAWVACKRSGSGIRQGVAISTLVIGWTLLPIVAWNMIRYTSLGHQKFLSRTQEWITFFRDAGSGAEGIREGTLTSRLNLLLDSVYLAPFAWVTGTFIITVLILARRYWHLSSAQPRWGIPATALLGTSAVQLIWWLVLAEEAWGRHILIAVYLSLPLLVARGVTRLTELTSANGGWLARVAKVSLALTFITLSFQATAHTFYAVNPPGYSLQQQRAVAHSVSTSGTATMLHLGWWQNPEIAFLSDTRSVDLRAQQSGLLVLGWLERELEPSAYEWSRARCDSVHYEANEYLLCWVDDSRQPQHGAVETETDPRAVR